jgi:hypothetical protein
VLVVKRKIPDPAGSRTRSSSPSLAILILCRPVKKINEISRQVITNLQQPVIGTDLITLHILMVILTGT